MSCRTSSYGKLPNNCQFQTLIWILVWCESILSLSSSTVQRATIVPCLHLHQKLPEIFLSAFYVCHTWRLGIKVPILPLNHQVFMSFDVPRRAALFRVVVCSILGLSWKVSRAIAAFLEINRKPGDRFIFEEFPQLPRWKLLQDCMLYGLLTVEESPQLSRWQ